MYYIMYRNEDGNNYFVNANQWNGERYHPEHGNYNARIFYTREYAEKIAARLNEEMHGLGYSRGPVVVRPLPNNQL